jgi:phage terminase large subunit-like protein
VTWNWDLSCGDWEQRLRDGRSLVPDLPLDLEAGARAVAAFNNLRLADVPDTPMMAEAGGDWLRDIVRALFGSLDPETGIRMIVELFSWCRRRTRRPRALAAHAGGASAEPERPRAPFALMAPVQDTAERLSRRPPARSRWIPCSRSCTCATT